MQCTYIDALEQQAKMRKLNIRFTDIRPGFVSTDLLKNEKYPLVMKPEKVAKSIFRAVVKKKRSIIFCLLSMPQNCGHILLRILYWKNTQEIRLLVGDMQRIHSIFHVYYMNMYMDKLLRYYIDIPYLKYFTDY